MKIYGNGIIWDKEKNSPLITFVNSEFETEDPEIIEKLTEYGYIENEESKNDEKSKNIHKRK